MMGEKNENEQVEPLHVHDLPQLYTKPSFSVLQNTLLSLATAPSTFSLPLALSSKSERKVGDHPPASRLSISPEGIPRYLTSIISSLLSWLSESEADEIRDLASIRLAERAGRTAVPDREQIFRIPVSHDDGGCTECGEKIVEIRLHEPSLTGDNLGLKTWGAGALLAGHMQRLKKHLLVPLEANDATVAMAPTRTLRMLELGAGTGIVGLAAAGVLQQSLEEASCMEIPLNMKEDTETENGKANRRTRIEIHMTDLPPIVPNLRKNVQMNAKTVGAQAINEDRDRSPWTVSSSGDKDINNKIDIFLSTGDLDWSLSPPFARSGAAPSPFTDGLSSTHMYSPPGPDRACSSFDAWSFSSRGSRYDLILVADPLYSLDHPRWLTNTISQNLLISQDGNGCHPRVISALPLRDHYADVRAAWTNCMQEAGFRRIESGLLRGRDEWGDGDTDDDMDECAECAAMNVEKLSSEEQEGGRIVVEWAVWGWA